MGFDRDTRKWGNGYTRFTAFTSTEVPLATIQSAADFGGTSTDSVLEIITETVVDEIHQEEFPLQIGVAGYQGTFKLMMSTGKAENLAVACGQAAPGSSSGTGRTAATAVIGSAKPSFISLLHETPNIHSPINTDSTYIPRCQVDPAFTYSTPRAGIRQAEVTFHVFASDQDEFLNPDDTHAGVKIYFETGATYDKCSVNKNVITALSTWNNRHNFNSFAVALVPYTVVTTTETLIGAGSLRNKTASYGQGRMSTSLTGDFVAFEAGVSDDIGTNGASEVFDVFTAASTWTLTAKNFAYALGELCVVVLNQYGEQIEPGSITVSAGAIGAGTVVCVFSENVRGSVLVFKEGPTGEVTGSTGGAVSVTLNAVMSEALVQNWSAGGVMIDAGSITRGSGSNQVTSTMSASIAFDSVAIF